MPEQIRPSIDGCGLGATSRSSESISFVYFVSDWFHESLRLAKKEDTLTILPGIAGAYPNRFFNVEKSQLKQFVDSILAAKSGRQFVKAMANYRMDRMDKRIWKTYDFVNSYLKASEGVEAGVIDLSRYEFE